MEGLLPKSVTRPCFYKFNYFSSFLSQLLEERVWKTFEWTDGGILN